MTPVVHFRFRYEWLPSVDGIIFDILSFLLQKSPINEDCRLSRFGATLLLVPSNPLAPMTGRRDKKKREKNLEHPAPLEVSFSDDSIVQEYLLLAITVDDQIKSHRALNRFSALYSSFPL